MVDNDLPDLERLTGAVAHLKQGTRYRGYYLYRNDKIQIDIERDAFEYMSHARAFVWSKKQQCWNRIAEIDYPNMKTPSNVGYHLKYANFCRDVLELNRLVKLILE
jgi:hypothetical protein